MNNNELQTEKLIQYLDGDLTASELGEFEKLLSENAGIQQELENLKLAKMAVQSYGLKTQVASVHQQMMQELKVQSKPVESKIYPFFRSNLKYAAAVLVILFALGAYLYITASPSKLYRDNYQPYQLSVVRGETTNTALENAYNTHNYDEVIRAFAALKQPGNKDYFLVGQAYESTGQPGNAISAFNKIINSPASENTFKDDAGYFLALAYLENNQPIKAEPIFEKIYSDKDHLYHDKVSYWTLLKLKLLTLKRSEK